MCYLLLKYYHDAFVDLFCLFLCSFFVVVVVVVAAVVVAVVVVVVLVFFTSDVIEYVKGLASPFK